MSTTSQKPLILYTARTPNGFKPSILLEELKLAYPENKLEYDVFGIEIWKTVHKEPWFIEMNPNGRIPTLTDHSRGDFHVFESAAILLYLAQHYDKENKFTFDPTKEADDYSVMMQWIFFAHGGVGPMMGQANHFVHYAPEKIKYASDRYVNESKRLWGALEIRLKDRDYLAGPGRGKYSLADINVWPWIRRFAYSVSETLDEWPNLKAWHERIDGRPGAQAGLNVPAEGSGPGLQ